MERIEIGLKPWTQKYQRPVESVRRRATIARGCGSVLILFGVGGLAIAIWGGEPEFFFGGPFLALVGALLLWNAIRSHRAVRSRSRDEVVQFAAPYAFALEGDERVFPAALTREEERWPLAATEFSLGSLVGGDVLVVESTERRPRRFPSAGLKQRPGEVLALVEQYQRERVATGRSDE